MLQKTLLSLMLMAFCQPVLAQKNSFMEGGQASKGYGADPFGGDSFGADADPFGGGGKSKDPFADPMGGDPFGGGGGKSKDPFADPMGGDPFGGGGGKSKDPFSDPMGGDSFGGGKGRDSFGDDPFGGDPMGGDPFSAGSGKRKNSVGGDEFGGGFEASQRSFDRAPKGFGGGAFGGQGVGAQTKAPTKAGLVLSPQDVSEQKTKTNFTTIALAWDKKGLPGKLSSSAEPGHLANASDDERDQQRTTDRKIFFDLAGPNPSLKSVADLEKGLTFFKTQGVDLVFCVGHPATDRNPELLQFLWNRHGERGPFVTELDGTSLAIKSGEKPTLEQLDIVSSTIVQHMRAGRHVLVMSGDGGERAGLVVAATYMRAFQEYNVTFVKKTINDELGQAIHTKAQIKTLSDFAAFLQKKGKKTVQNDSEASLTGAEKNDARKGLDDHHDAMSDDEIDAAAEGGDSDSDDNS